MAHFNRLQQMILWSKDTPPIERFFYENRKRTFDNDNYLFWANLVVLNRFKILFELGTQVSQFYPARISQMCSLGSIFAKRFLDEIILDLFSCAHTEKSQNKSRNHDLQKCYQEVTFEKLNLDTSYHCQAPSMQFLLV